MQVVALRKESVDRNINCNSNFTQKKQSLSARRAWIEIEAPSSAPYAELVALRKESVDRNKTLSGLLIGGVKSLSARRAWIEMRVPYL